MIEIRLNGDRTQVPEGLNIQGLLHHLDIHADRVAVELNRSIIRKPEWEASIIQPGDEVEVVHFVGGGTR
ncbi:thiamine biosynthesis protein ThiS [Bryobacterales bacterium F-183]|nr:thiamine biosynthesis protein ThiS [Bryobacterales bacterium F-183]